MKRFTTAAMAAAALVAAQATALASECGTGVATVEALMGSNIGFTPAQGNGPDNWELEEGGMYALTLSGVTECSGDTITVFIQSSISGNFCLDSFGTSQPSLTACCAILTFSAARF